ncbi:hypothetical protein L228DRAFT_243764 [Xylona heveae TC161]|uniref:Secreted protein n=1 Tax=Xylona heveae (strain CBS 132557 / TC161) TaxID=1328760 RepID=A0A161TFX9_XYLHT|nr:hypothetical protein L228DRAFT_243764 [Xylona heveae TC161]KZF24997.1 hypothetical protein L228DRAFT_243764 [Xylona heveae TC161]
MFASPTTLTASMLWVLARTLAPGRRSYFPADVVVHSRPSLLIQFVEQNAWLGHLAIAPKTQSFSTSFPLLVWSKQWSKKKRW